MSREADRPENNWQEISRRGFLHRAGAAAAALALRRLPGALTSGWTLPAQTKRVISVTEPAFGARGDGKTNDWRPFQAAIDEAIRRGLPLWIPAPPDYYRIDLDAHKPLTVHGDLTIIGAGRRAVALRFGIPSPNPSKTYSAFFIRNGCEFRIADLRLEEDVHPTDFEFQGLLYESGPNDHQSVIERVDVEGFTNVVISNASGVGDGKGELFITVRACDFRPFLRYCIALWTVEEGHKRLHLYDSYFHDNRHSHLIYCHPHNSVHVENCRFDGATDWAFHFQGSAVAGDPEYQRFIGCWFGPRNNRGLITQDRETVATTVEVCNCLFEGRPAIQIRSDILIDGCYFTTVTDPPNDVMFIAAYSNAPWKATIRNCVFAPKANSLPQIDLRLENIEATIENCQFYNQGAGVILVLGDGAANRYRVSNCLFYNRADNGAQAVSVEINNGQAILEDCVFMGETTHDRGVIVLRGTDSGPAADASLRIDGCAFESIGGGSMVYALFGPAGNGWSDKVSGGRNRLGRLVGDKPLLLTEPTGPFVAHLSPTAGSAPAALDAAPVVVLSSNYDTYRVNGPAEVTRLHWWSDDGLSDNLFSGAVTLMAVSPFALANSGNIRLGGDAARRDVAGGASVRLTFSPETGLWTETA